MKNTIEEQIDSSNMSAYRILDTWINEIATTINPHLKGDGVSTRGDAVVDARFGLVSMENISQEELSEVVKTTQDTLQKILGVELQAKTLNGENDKFRLKFPEGNTILDIIANASKDNNDMLSTIIEMGKARLLNGAKKCYQGLLSDPKGYGLHALSICFQFLTQLGMPFSALDPKSIKSSKEMRDHICESFDPKDVEEVIKFNCKTCKRSYEDKMKAILNDGIDRSSLEGWENDKPLQ